MPEYIRRIDKCSYVQMLGDTPVCTLNCGPCERVDPKYCEAIEIPEDNYTDTSDLFFNVELCGGGQLDE